MCEEQTAPWRRVAAFVRLAGAGEEEERLGRAMEIGRGDREERSEEGASLEKVL